MRDFVDKLPLVKVNISSLSKEVKGVRLFPLQGGKVCFDLVILRVFALHIIVDAE